MPLSNLNIKELTEFIRKNDRIGSALAKEKQVKLAKARLKLACWVCKTEGVEPNINNLADIIGEHFKSTVPYIKDVMDELGPDGPQVD